VGVATTEPGGTAVPTDVQIVIDSQDPHRLVRFWAEALGYEVERDDGMIQGLLDAGQASPDDVVEVDGGLGWKVGAACRDPEAVRPRVLLQLVPEAKSVKNRVHLDLRVGDEGRAHEVARLEALGATRLWDGQQGPFSWVTMADPEGNEFCVT
jgi:hypothetical protein